ncbi:hypothetical protein BKA80DRAFT_273712 [Phyllosticta citrichinensis]
MLHRGNGRTSLVRPELPSRYAEDGDFPALQFCPGFRRGMRTYDPHYALLPCPPCARFHGLR